jgi:hypothetical protein
VAPIGMAQTGLPALDKAPSGAYKPQTLARVHIAAWAQVAQLVEHVTENHGVGGSIPPLGTITIKVLVDADHGLQTLSGHIDCRNLDRHQMQLRCCRQTFHLSIWFESHRSSGLRDELTRWPRNGCAEQGGSY